MGYQHSLIIWASPERTWSVGREAERKKRYMGQEDGKEAWQDEAMAQYWET